MCREPPIPGGLFWESPTLCGKWAQGFLFLSEAALHLDPLAESQQCRSLPSWCTWPRVRRGEGSRPTLCHLWFQVAWVKWMDSSASFTMMPDTNYCNIIVPTMDTIQMSYLLDMLLTNHKPVSAPAMPCFTPHFQGLGQERLAPTLTGRQLVLHAGPCESALTLCPLLS